MDIPIQNIYYLLCYAWNKLDEGEIIDVENIDSTQLADLFAKVLSGGIIHLLKRGIDRNYLEFDDELRTLRGKVDFSATVSRNLFQKGKAICYYDDLNHDILHNQILKTTLRNLISVDSLDDRLRNELIRLYRYFYHISEIKLDSKVFTSVRLNRNNIFYTFLINICELVYENLLPSENKGKSRFRDFVKEGDKMNSLFQNFIYNFYRIEVKEFNVSSEFIFWDVDEQSKKFFPRMQTDISLENLYKKIIIDTKYYKDAFQHNFDTTKFISSNVNQMYAYLKQVEKKGGINNNAEGILLYPAVDSNFYHTTNLDGHKFAFASIDLNQNWKDIHKSLIALIS